LTVAAGEGAMPITNGYADQLQDHGAFDSRQRTDFVIVAVRRGCR
jgi:hypothetical protein